MHALQKIDFLYANVCAFNVIYILKDLRFFFKSVRFLAI
jgi:hypothetical protein